MKGTFLTLVSMHLNNRNNGHLYQVKSEGKETTN